MPVQRGSDAIITSLVRGVCGEIGMGNACASVNQRGAGTIGQTYRTSALLFHTENLENWQARYTWVFFFSSEWIVMRNSTA